MNSQTVMLNFSDLKNLTSIEIVEAISSQTAVEVTLYRSIKSCEVSADEIYKTWCTSLFQSYGPSRINDTDLTTLFDSFSTAIRELLNECGNCQNDEQIEKLNQFLNYSLELFTWIYSTASEFETNKITSFLCFGLSSIHNYLVVLSKQTSRIAARKLIEKSLQIHTLILGILTSNPQAFHFDADKSSLESLMSGLCSVGEIAPKLDIKSAVETWKCVTRLASQNVTHSQSEDIFGDDNDSIWLTKPMSFLIKEIGRNVQTVYTQDSLSEPIQQIEKFLRVTNFYLRLLQKISNDFNYVPFPICEEFIGTLAVVFNPPAYISNTPVYKVIMNFIGKDLKELMPLAYRNEQFLEQLLSEHFENIHSKEAIHEIVLQLIEVIIRKDEPKYISEKLLDASFKYISDARTSTVTYNRFVEILSSLQIRFNDERIKKKLVTTILHDNTTQALAAIDIWCTIFMLSDNSIKQSYLKFWININERFAQFSTNMPALHTELLLKNFYKLLSPQEKTDVWTKFTACTLRNDRLFLTIGLDAIPICPAKQSIIQHFQNELFGLLKETGKEKTIQGYYTIVKDLKLLKTIDFKNDDVIEMLLQYLEIAMEDKNLYQMVESILDFLAPRIGYIDGSKIQRILSMINMNISLFEEFSTKLCFIGFLKYVAKLSKFEKTSKDTLKTLQSDEEIKRFAYVKDKNTNVEDNEEKRDKLWKEIIQNRSMDNIQRAHICRTTKASRPILIPNKSQIEIEDILESLENNANKLQTETQNRQLSTSNLETIKKVILKLKEVSKMDL